MSNRGMATVLAWGHPMIRGTRTRACSCRRDEACDVVSLAVPQQFARLVARSVETGGAQIRGRSASHHGVEVRYASGRSWHFHAAQGWTEEEDDQRAEAVIHCAEVLGAGDKASVYRAALRSIAGQVEA